MTNTVGWTFMSTRTSCEFTSTRTNCEFMEIGDDYLSDVDHEIIYPPIVSNANTCTVDMNVHPTEHQ